MKIFQHRGIDFTGTIKGLANVKTICQGRTSAAVVEVICAVHYKSSKANGFLLKVYSLIGADVAGIMAHEMGHNFGMQHDEDSNALICTIFDGM